MVPPREDVRAGLLEPTERHTSCPLKVDAPTLGEALAVRDHLSFYPDRVNIRVDDAPPP